MISHRFIVNGGQDDVRSWIEVRCTQCGIAQPFADDGHSAYLSELVEWAEAHKCHRGQHTNTTGRSTDRPLRTNIKQDGQPDFVNLFGNSPSDYSSATLEVKLVAEFRSKHPEVTP